MKIARSLIIIATLLSFSVFVVGEELPVEDWLVVQAKVFKPAFTGEFSSVFDYSSLDLKSLWPRDGQKLHWDPHKTLTWEKVEAQDGKLFLSLKEGSTLILAATYLDVQRWHKATLLVKSSFPFLIIFDGELMGKAEKTDLTLTREKHLLLIASLQDRTKQAGLEVSLQFDDKFKSEASNINTDPAHDIILLEALSYPKLSGAELHPEGSQTAFLNSDGGIEIRNHPDGKLLQTIFLSGHITSYSWSPEGNRLAMITAGEKGLSDLWLTNLKEKSTKKLFAGIKGMSQLHWLPDGKFISYTTTESPPEKGPYELVDNFFDRWEGWKSKIHLWIASVEDGTRHMITGGLSPYGWSRQALISPDGKKVVFVNETPSSHYPYSNQELWLVDILSGQSELISKIKTARIQTMRWSPDSTQLVMVAPYYNIPLKPSDPVHSRFHQGILLWDISQKSSRYLTKPEFNPSVHSIWWNPKDTRLYFIALDRTVKRLYRFSPDLKAFSEINLPFINIQELFGAKNSDWVILQVGAIDRPSWFVWFNLETLEHHSIPDKVQEEFFSFVRLGKHEMFYCKNRGGTQLDGWIYFPPGFDPEKKYPLIVYYYGGVLPMTQSFYPMHLWFAANNYVVYTLTPRGTDGYGQEFADAHINEWGTVSSPDIIDAVKALLKAKSYIDPKRVGGIGGSYGGFEGLSLITQTDLFATVIASSVISNTLNYSLIVLGQPNYGEIVLPGVYPWNRKDIYVERSPVFNADKVKTPLLLIHGTEDPWCEMTESDQMYSALKIQGKDVVQIRWIGEAHGISKFSSFVLNERIKMEWFDKYLKGEPEGWQERYHKSRK